MPPKVFIVILHYGDLDDTLECVRSLENNDYPNFKVVIVDNDPAHRFPALDRIVLLRNKRNLGFPAGNNVGIKYAFKNGADYVLLLNNDTLTSADFLRKMVEAGEDDKKIGVVGPKICFADDPKRIWYAGGRVNWLRNKGAMRGWDEPDAGQYDQPAIQKTDYVTGCCLLIKKEVVAKIGLLPGEYFLYYEDTDWSLRARRAGYLCAFVPAAKIWHKISRASKPGSSSYIYYHVRNGLMLARRFAPWYVLPFVYLDSFWRALKQIPKFALPSKRVWAKAILLGIRDFYLGKTGAL